MVCKIELAHVWVDHFKTVKNTQLVSDRPARPQQIKNITVKNGFDEIYQKLIGGN